MLCSWKGRFGERSRNAINFTSTIQKYKLKTNYNCHDIFFFFKFIDLKIPHCWWKRLLLVKLSKLMAECKSYMVESMYPVLCSVLYLTIFTANVPNITRAMLVFIWLSVFSMKQIWIIGCCTIDCTRLDLSGRWSPTFQPYTQASWTHTLFHIDICLNHHNRLLCKKMSQV